MTPAIVVIGYNRPKSIVRVLDSISRANYVFKDITLCICIDFEESSENRQVLEIANSFCWKYGHKRVIHQAINLGLKAHILKCGDLVNEYGSIIMLEDDLTVSHNFYTYANNALKFYQLDNQIAGVSLYNHKLNFNNLLPFEPIVDDSDVYFIKVASSWGQAWTKEQWGAFKSWYKTNLYVDQQSYIPTYVKNWPDSSWLKHFINFCQANDKYFVFPRISYSTNWSDTGTNNAKPSTFFQVPLEQGKVNSNFIELNDSVSRYDSHFELCAELSVSYPGISNSQIEFDLYGTKEIFEKPYVISCKKCKHPLKTYGLDCKPLVLNILYKVEGKMFSLGKAEDFNLSKTLKDQIAEKHIYNYFFGSLGFLNKVRHIVKLFLNRYFQK